jgi:hypothetical protein
MTKRTLIFDPLAYKERQKILEQYQLIGQIALDFADINFKHILEIGENIGKYRKFIILNQLSGKYNFTFKYIYTYNNYKIKVYTIDWSVEYFEN